MKPFIVLSILCALFWTPIHAQILKPVKWSYAAKKTSATEATIYIKATMEQGWHIYALDTPEEGPVRTSIAFTPDESYQLKGTLLQPQPVTKMEQQFGKEVKYFEKTVVFQQKIKLQAGSTTVKGDITFMVCSDQQCLPPGTIPFSVDIK
ncbi:protein-disulfide reductase DsbD N-terminal domain-containing protein [Chitinophaga filiformis]|uniref:protein-disulfide reductase DsbD domain-containing protein n=1 Tax=Chitinophaga filiformis TaxID=104663 RepID=UPI001F26CFB6|nr:protein-disulfide reductase DsbD domain-containing protein [Chitinophaga filiformis]MCF6404109.1 protein-disulfide reductase DsbD N-terminal domain-containing protein [Chitinophaga filiformis]